MFLIEASPLTGRTHQIRVHASENGFPILGDTAYGGAAFSRVCLHAASLEFQHPATHAPLKFEVPIDFFADPRMAFREGFIEPEATDAFRVLHGAADGVPGSHMERLGEYILTQSDQREIPAGITELDLPFTIRGHYHKTLLKNVRQATVSDASPKLLGGEAAPARFEARENGVRYELSFSEGYSYGLFLDQRDNRRRLLTNHVAAEFPLFPGGAAGREVLNTFAYTCAFSVCAALAGARTTSLDLSPKYLEWGRRNFALNGVDPAAHDFIYGDCFDWLHRLAKKGRAFDAIVLDPPTFSQSKERGRFSAEKDYGELVAAALPVLKPGGVLLASTNAATLKPEVFLTQVTNAIGAARRRVAKQHYVPQPPDFPITRTEPAYLKTVWLMVQ